ncbi:TPA: hypothetical protein ACGO2N_001651 [Streptococcus suis]|nr:hypothetical protein [Streptococcus suis]
MKNTSKEQATFNDIEVLEIYIDLLYRKLSSDIKLRNPFDSINRELQHFFELPLKKFNSQLLHVISDRNELKRDIIEYLECYFIETSKKVKHTTGVSLVFELTHNNALFEVFNLVIIEDIDVFYNCSDKIQKRISNFLKDYLENGGKLLITGSNFDSSNDSLSQILYQGSLLNLTC